MSHIDPVAPPEMPPPDPQPPEIAPPDTPGPDIAPDQTPQESPPIGPASDPPAPATF